MLIDSVVQFCDEMYSSFGDKCGCENGQCNHPSGECSGSCYNCLYHIHFPDRAPENAKKEYDCVKMLYHYVCQYSFLYTTELLCAFDHEWDYIKGFPYYHILSLGCGGCADLMAFDYLRQSKKFPAPISYMGIDVNDLWAPIHQKIREYCRITSIPFNMRYKDVFEYFQKYKLPNANIIVISYLISYLYNTNQINAVDLLADNLVKKVITHKKTGQPLLLVINDVNSNARGRDSFEHFIHSIRRNGLTIGKSEFKYFESGRLNSFQRIGSAYSIDKMPLSIPNKIKEKYHAQTNIQSTIQLLVEVS